MQFLLLPFLAPLVLAGHVQHPFASQDANVTLVPVTLGVMSRCPDAALCESVFDDVLNKVMSKVELSLTFIGQLNDSDETYGVTCKHGPQECAGNIHELCMISRVPQTKWWPYVICLNFMGKDKIGLGETAKRCAEVVSVDWVESGIEACVDGLEGSDLLRESVRNTTALGIEKSCTILINGVTRCIVDDGRWLQCDYGHTSADFVAMINKEYAKLNP
ncbi:hypothetical protein DACRYDRAFT_19671 [Dacryopinax primogenitus]|uniref:GILT-domain-containing protein n=1 Tax=Dacryopinax primogenitus (strain DJM 731) TaxID=1858805 RepID=M5G8N4_DACPD|nr:uncharacterized protein DACRYDRAFT_19671 [Dacryopinax primogenitus]EJU06576.1 hypothetical protein DACRYDRAFT_19671 [Dacryopinax primogenitus]